MNNETIIEYHHVQKTNQIVAVLLPTSIGIIGLLYLCLRKKCKNKENNDESISSIEPIVSRV